MTPIEKLRKGLDERGVKHIDHDGSGRYDPDTTHWSLYEKAFKYTSKQEPDRRLYVKTSGAANWVEMTPEQAIIATVGVAREEVATWEQESIVCDFLRKISPERDWMYLGEVEHAWISEMVRAIVATISPQT